MADSKLKDLSAVGTPVLTDLLYLLADPGGSPLDRKMTLTQLKTLLGGQVVQVVNAQTGAVATGTTVIPADDSIPQNTEGTEFMALATTPTNANHKLKIDVVVFMSCATASRNICVALFQDAGADAIAVGPATEATGGFIAPIKFTHYMTAGTTSATTFKVRAGVETSGTVTLNGSGGARRYGGVMASSITIAEIRA